MKVLLIDQIAKTSYRYSYSMANSIKKQGIDITLVTDLKEDEETLNCNRIRMFNTDEKNISKISKLLNYFKSMHKILNIMRQGVYDVLHTQWIIFSPVDYFYLKRIKKTGKKIVITIHDILPFNKKFYDFYYHKKIYALADNIILQNKENIRKFKKMFPYNNASISMIPHGHFLEYAETQPQDISRAKLGVEENRFVYLFFGQIKKVKGVDILLKAYAQLLSTRSELKEKTMLIIAGNTWKTDIHIYEELITKLALENNVKTYIQFIPDKDIGYYYGAANVCVLPYVEVYQSGVLQLTYAHHKAPIVTDIPAFLDVVNNERGFICHVNDVDSLCNEMWKCYEENDKLDDMSEKGYLYIKDNFDWDKIGEKIKKTYER